MKHSRTHLTRAMLLVGGAIAQVASPAIATTYDRYDGGSFFWEEEWTPEGVPGGADAVRLFDYPAYPHRPTFGNNLILGDFDGRDVDGSQRPTPGSNVTLSALEIHDTWEISLGARYAWDQRTLSLTGPVSLLVGVADSLKLTGHGLLVTSGDVVLERGADMWLVEKDTTLDVGNELIIKGSATERSTVDLESSGDTLLRAGSARIGVDDGQGLLRMRGGHAEIRGMLSVGDGGTGAITIDQDSTLFAARIDAPADGSASIDVNSGHIRVDATLDLGTSGAGTLSMERAATVECDTLRIGSGALIDLNAAQHGGRSEPFIRTRHLNISGGTLRVDFGFTPRPGTAYTLITSPDISGSFDDIEVNGATYRYEIDTTAGLRVVFPVDQSDPGACCVNEQCVADVTPSACSDLGGDFMGQRSNCSDVDCFEPEPPTGACCFSDDTCTEDLTRSACLTARGSFRGNNKSCAEIMCPLPPPPLPGPVVCCFGNALCYEIYDAVACGSLGGVFHGSTKTCADIECGEPTGACCLGEHNCVEYTAHRGCAEMLGVFRGPNTRCADVPCYPSDLPLSGEGLALYDPADNNLPWGWLDRGDAGTLEPDHGYQWGLTGDHFLGGEPLAAWADGFGEPVAVRPEGPYLTWYVLLNDDIRFSYDASTTGSFGLAGDRPVIGRFLDDGADHAAVASTDTWFVIDGDRNLQYDPAHDPAWPFSPTLAPNDCLLAGDIAGSDLDDVVIWRETQPWGWFQVHENTGGAIDPNVVAHIQFGLAGDLPAVGDVNGDGHDDLIVFRPALSLLYVNLWEADDPWPGLADADVDYEIDYFLVTQGHVWSEALLCFDYDGPDGAPDPAPCPSAALYHVDDTASGIQDGSSWDDAFTDLQDAIAAAEASCAEDVEIWVARGLYKPDAGSGNRSQSFELSSGVRIFGGFAGHEVLRDERDPDANPTVLSGDLADNDDGTWEGRRENSNSIVTAIGVDRSATLDGFTISDGYDNSEYHGAAVDLVESSCTLSNIAFVDNKASTRGGAVSIRGGSPAIRDCTFLRNSTNSGGWGGSVSARDATVEISGCTFYESLALRGGAIVAESATTLAINACDFEYNTALTDGGALAIFNSECTMTDSALRNNTGQDGRGGAIHISRSSADLSGAVFTDNTAGRAGALWAYDTDITAASCLFESNTASPSPSQAGDAGAVFLNEGAALTMSRSRFVNNLAGRGGALFVANSAATIDTTTFSANAASVAGGALSSSDAQAVVELASCLINENVAPDGAALHTTRAGQTHLYQCTVIRNEADPGAVALDATDGSISITNSIVWDNGAVLESPVPQIDGQVLIRNSIVQASADPGAIDADPRFLGGADGDYRLGAGSPAIDNADPQWLVPWNQADLEGDDRSSDAENYDAPWTSDIGACEAPHWIEAAPAPAVCNADLDADGDTDVFDFNIFASTFGATGITPGTGGDLDSDGDVDVFDFNIFATNFGCTP